jgi:hypothetical protein
MEKTKSSVQKYFRQMVPLSVEARKEYVDYKNKFKSKTDTVNYNAQLNYNWHFCNRCWRRFSFNEKPYRVEYKGHKFDLCDSCKEEKNKWIRNSIVDIDDIIELGIDMEKLFKLKEDFYKKY